MTSSYHRMPHPTDAAIPDMSNDPGSNELRKFEEAVQNGGQFTMRSALGQVYGRYIANNPDKKRELDMTPGRAGKAALRAKWANEQYQMLKQQKVYTESSKSAWSNDGKYMAFVNVLKAEGGDLCMEGRRAAELYCYKCMMMGGKWVQYNPMTERLEFLYITRGLSEVFSKEWAAVEDEHQFSDVAHATPKAPPAPLCNSPHHSIMSPISSPSSSQLEMPPLACPPPKISTPVVI
eukprot:8327122-Karenia_brevis.AAC.1